jgi:hypothetical protein
MYRYIYIPREGKPTLFIVDTDPELNNSLINATIPTLSVVYAPLK